jgi:hypothetical protein
MRWGSQRHPCTRHGGRMSRKEKALGGRLGPGVDDRLRLSHGGRRLYTEGGVKGYYMERVSAYLRHSPSIQRA